MVSRIYIAFEIKVKQTFFYWRIKDSIQKHYICTCVNSFNSICLILRIQSWKVPEKYVILKWQPAYDVSKHLTRRMLNQNERQRTFLRFASWTKRKLLRAEFHFEYPFTIKSDHSR